MITCRSQLVYSIISARSFKVLSFQSKYFEWSRSPVAWSMNWVNRTWTQEAWFETLLRHVTHWMIFSKSPSLHITWQLSRYNGILLCPLLWIHWKRYTVVITHTNPKTAQNFHNWVWKSTLIFSHRKCMSTV